MNEKTEIGAQMLPSLLSLIHSPGSQTGSFISNEKFEFQSFISNCCMSYIYLDISLSSNLVCPKPNLPHKLAFLLSWSFLCAFKTLSYSKPPTHFHYQHKPSVTSHSNSFCMPPAAGLSLLHQCLHHPAPPGGLWSKSQVQKQASRREEMHLGKWPWGLTLDSSIV